MFRCLSINDLRKCKSAHDRRKSNRKKQHGERGMTAILLKKIIYWKYSFDVDKKILLQNFRYEKITIINKPLDQQFHLYLIRESINQNVSISTIGMTRLKTVVSNRCLFFSFVYECVSLLPACRPRFRVNVLFLY